MCYKKTFSNFCELFEQSLLEFPSNTAVIFGQNSLTFSELNDMSSQYACHLIECGVKKGDIVALVKYNELDLIAIILAVWKVNAVYLPIDPNYPNERIKTMLDDANPKLLITTKELKEKFNFFERNSLLIDRIKNSPTRPNLPVTKKDDLAYIIYTSGTTSGPKGIMVDHHGLVHAALAYKDLHPKSFISLVAGSISFDPSLLTIVHCLATGGSICLYDNRDGIDIRHPNKIISLLQKNSVSFILSTPSFYSKLLEENIELPSLKNVDLCGENISQKLVEKHAEIAPNASLYNVYGPTEYAMGTTAALIYDPKGKQMFEITIGKSYSSNKAYILDGELKETRDNEKGEISVGGPGIAKGYMNLDNLTKEKFIWVNALEKNPVKLYRTGDIGYRRPNGNIIFVGRADLQVKIEGHRVELEEIELIIDNSPYVDKSIVIASSSTSNKTELIAFFLPNQTYSEVELNEYLSRRLPPYMFPSKFFKVDSWPTTKNGKIDRNALKGHINQD